MILTNIKYILLTPKSKFIFLVFILSALSFNHAFTFHLFLDDWYQILGALYYPEILSNVYLRIHPISVLEFETFSNIFKFNTYLWHFLGYLLKVIDSLSMWILIIALTKSKKAATYSCLISAVFVVGMESFFWPSAHSSAIVIPLINLGFYFWIRSEGTFLDKRYFYSLCFFTLTILAEPGRGITLLLLIPIWEFLSIFQKFNKKILILSFLRLFMFFLIVLIISFIIKKYFQINPDLNALFYGLKIIDLKNIILFLENPLFGWTLIPNQFLYWPTVLFLFISFLSLLLFLWKKYDIYKIIFFLTIWVPLFYLPNFLAQSYARFGMGTESRYYAISAIGVIGLISYILSFLNFKKINLVIALFLLFNIFVTNNILEVYSKTWSSVIFDKIWDKIDSDVPKDEKFSIFMFSGEDFTQRTSLLDWQNSIPFAVKRGITKKEDYPIMTDDKKLIARLICEKEVSRPSPFGEIIQKDPISLSNIHAWELKKDREFINRSEIEQYEIKKLATCLK